MENSQWSQWLPEVVGSEGGKEQCVAVKGQQEGSLVTEMFCIVTVIVDT